MACLNSCPINQIFDHALDVLNLAANSLAHTGCITGVSLEKGDASLDRVERSAQVVRDTADESKLLLVLLS